MYDDFRSFSAIFSKLRLCWDKIIKCFFSPNNFYYWYIVILGPSQQFPVCAKFSVNWDLVIFQVKTSEHLKNDYVPVYAKFSENWKMKTEKTEIRWYFLKDVVSMWTLVTKIVGGSYGKTAEIVKRTFSWLKNAKSQAPLEHF